MLIYGYPTGRQGKIRRRKQRRRKRIAEIKAVFAAIGLIITTALMYGGVFALLLWVVQWFK